MYKEITNIIKDTLSRYIGVNFVRYSGDDLNNQQHNAKTIQCYIDDVTLHRFSVTGNYATVEYSIYILGFPENQTPDSILDVQDQCYDLACNLLAYIDNKDEWRGIISVHDYSIVTLARYTAQSNAGVRLQVEFIIPSGVNLCTLDEHFGEPYVPEPDAEITVDTKQVPDTLKITPIKLPKSGC